jgi:hypothetical protein
VRESRTHHESTRVPLLTPSRCWKNSPSAASVAPAGLPLSYHRRAHAPASALEAVNGKRAGQGCAGRGRRRSRAPPAGRKGLPARTCGPRNATALMAHCCSVRARARAPTCAVPVIFIPPGRTVAMLVVCWIWAHHRIRSKMRSSHNIFSERVSTHFSMKHGYQLYCTVKLQ